MGRIEHAQILQAAGGLDMRQQTIQKLTLTLAIENNHRHFSTAKAAFQVLRDDVLKKRRFACAGTAHDHTVLHPHNVRPKPRLFVHVIPEQCRRVLVGVLCSGSILCSSNKDWRVRPVLFPLPASTYQLDDDQSSAEEENGAV